MDLGQLSDQQLQQLYQASQPPPASPPPADVMPPASASADITQMSNADLARAYQKARQLDPDALAAFGKKRYDEQQGAPDQAAPLSWGDVAKQGVMNVPSSGYNFASGVVQPFIHPIETGKNVYHLGRGLLEKSGAVSGDEDVKYADAAGAYFADRYGSMAGFKRAMAEDPVGVLGDLSTVASGGETALARLPGIVGKVGEVAGTVGRLTNPLTPVVKTASGLGSLAQKYGGVGQRVPNEVVDATQRLSDAGTSIEVPRAVTSASPVVRAGGQALSKAPIVGSPLRQAVEAVPAQMSRGVEAVADQYGRATPQNVGGRIEQGLSEAAGSERAASEATAAATDAEATRNWERANEARVQAITDRQTQADAAARRTFGNANPIEMAEDTIRAVQDRHAADEGRNQARWEAINQLDAHVNKDSFFDLHDTVDQGIKDANVTLDPERTPNAVSMMQEIRRLSARPGEAPPNVPPRLLSALEREYGQGQVPPSVFEQLGFAGGTAAQDPQFRLLGRHAPAPDATTVPVQGMEELRKRIGDMAFDATSNTDRWASNAIKNAFGDWYGDALDNHLAPGGSTGARQAINDALASHRDFKTRFGYNASELAGENRSAAQMLNQMATGDVGPENVARNLVGSKPGNRGVSAPLHDAIMGAVDNPAQVRAGMRGAYWNAITRGRSPDAIASAIADLRPTRMGRNLFEPHEHDLMGGYADLTERTPEDLRQAVRTARENRPEPTKVAPGEAQQLAARVVGRRSEEQVFDKIDTMAREGGDLKGLGQTWRAMPEASRDEFRGAWLRNMGGGSGDDFNVSQYVKNWESYPAQAKAVILGFSGPHLRSLEDVYTVAKQYADTIKKYGNPSGTAQVSAWHNLAKGALKTGAALAVGTMPDSRTPLVLHLPGSACTGPPKSLPSRRARNRWCDGLGWRRRISARQAQRP